MANKRHRQSLVYPEENKLKCIHTHSHIGMWAQTNTQTPKPAYHLSADRRNTPATSFQSAFHHSVTTCQLQSLSLHHTALIFTNCAAAWDTTQPCQKCDTGGITFLHLLAYKHTHVLILRLLHPCTSMSIHFNYSPSRGTASMHQPQQINHTLLVKCTSAHAIQIIDIKIGLNDLFVSVV